MTRAVVAVLVLVLSSSWIQAQNYSITGRINDTGSNEPVIGAMVVLAGTNHGAISGLDGSFAIRNIPAGTYNLECSFVSFNKHTEQINLTSDKVVNIRLVERSSELGEVVIVASRNRVSEGSARADEKNSMTVMNVLSAQNIELSPDISAANAIQRVSGISLQRSSTGDGQHAILRGMDKRYNYTTVNGIKIPSPDNNNRYVPLDIFPADIIGRMEVSKALTPDMEGDAIGGAINMELRDAPDELMVHASTALGYNTFFFGEEYRTFNRRVVNPESPAAIHGTGHNASIDEFPMENGVHESGNAPLAQLYTLSLGGRVGKKKKLGVLVSGSYNSTPRGSESLIFDTRTDQETNRPELRSIINTSRSTLQERAGLHAKIDYRFNKNHAISAHSMYSYLSEAESRLRVDTSLTFNRNGPGTGRIENWYRTR